MKTKICFRVIVCAGIALASVLIAPASSLHALQLSCPERHIELMDSLFACYLWYTNPPHSLWRSDPSVQGVVVIDITHDQNGLIKSVKGVDSQGDTVGLEFSVTGSSSARASLYYNSYEQARITEQFHSDSVLEVALIYYPNQDLSVSYVATLVADDTFHVEYRIGGDTISGCFAVDEEQPLVMVQFHEAISQIQDSALIGALDSTLLDPVSCQFVDWLEAELELRALDTDDKICLGATLVADIFCLWGCSAVTGGVNIILLSYIPEPVPTLTEWGLIIFGVVLIGFITWVFLRRRRVSSVRV